VPNANDDLVKADLVKADLVKADLALAELPRARGLPLEDALPIVCLLANATDSSAARTLSTEGAQFAAWLSICAVGLTLDDEGCCPEELWDKAIASTRYWRELLV
jgi:hypothetical protein